MRIMTLGLKVSLIVASMVAAIIGIIIYIVSVQSDALVADLAAKEAKAANLALAREVRSLQNDAFSRAGLIAYSHDVIDAVLNKNEAALKEALEHFGEGMDVVTVCDAGGNVLMRTHSGQKGDNVKNQKTVAAALAGTSAGTIERGAVAGLGTRGSAAIKDFNGNIIGAVTCGHNLSNPVYVDGIKETNGCEVTLFDGDTRYMTTLTDESGSRVIGTKASEKVIETVIRQKKEYPLQIALFGHEYFAYYSPLVVDGDVIGMLFAGVLIDNALAGQQSMMLMLLVTGIACGALCILAVLIFNYYSVSRPLRRLTTAVSEVARGNIHINMDKNKIKKNEIGDLNKDIHSLVDAIKMILDELAHMAMEHDRGEIGTFLDTENYKGAFKEVAAGTNEMVKSHINTNKMAVACFNAIANGDFDADIEKLPGKKVFINEAIDELRSILKQVNSEIHTMVLSAIDGELSRRIDAGRYKGGWASLMNEMNGLMEAIIAPINEASEILGRVSEGNFDRRMNGAFKGDFRVIKESINTTVTNIASYIEEISTVLNALAGDNLDQDIKRGYAGKFSEIKNALLNIIGKYNKVISNIASASGQVASGAKKISEGSANLAKGATEQASSVEELNATIQTINENIMQNAESAKEADKRSGNLKIYAEKGVENMNQMLHSMNGIKDSSNQISKIIKVIEDIAFQTNLLALNAAVEAARAGAHGKGFSIVADEVRTLSGKTSVSAKETAELIKETIVRVSEGTETAFQADEALKTIVYEVAKVAEIITNISGASGEQAAAIGHVMAGVGQITEVVQSNSASAEESASASLELAGQSDVLRDMVSVFRLKRG